MEDPGKYSRFARKNCYQKSDGKCIDYIFGIIGSGDKATSEVQALRYPKTTWTEAAAKKHCKGKGGSFEAAKKTEGKSEMGDDALHYRTISLRAAGKDSPSTFNRETRTVDITLSTEEPVMVWGENEILLSDGARIPKDKKIIMLDTHNRYTVDGVLGSIRNLHKSNGEVVGTAHFSTRVKAEDAMLLVEEGHLTDFSVGYKVNKFLRVAEKETQKIKGREFVGPLIVVTDWTPREGSVAPIGADSKAKVRADGPEQGKGVNEMDKRLKNYLISRGLDKDATDDQAWEFLARLEKEDGQPVKPPAEPPKPATPARTEPDPPEGDDTQAREEGARAERNRIAEINGMGERLGEEELARQLIDEGVSLDAARERFLKRQMEKDSPTVRATVATDERDKFRAAAVDSLLLRGNVEVETPAPGANELQGFSLRELARESLRTAGLRTGGPVHEMIGRALTTSDFPYILADSARKSLFVGWDTSPETWSTWCGTGNVSDFKQHSSVRASEMDDLDEVPEHGEYQYGGRTEAKEVYQIATYGKIFAITRQTIINDDLNALTDVPRGHGEAAARKVGDVAYAVLTANAAMGDGVALFHANHSNLGSAAVVSETTVGEAVKLMGLQKDIGGKRRLNIRVAFFMAPLSIMTAAEIFYNSEMFGGAATDTTRRNIFFGQFTRVYEGRLDDASTTAYYFAGPRGKTVTVFFLNGVQAPYLETKTGWTVDGIEYKVRIDAGAKAMDWRGLVKNAGA